MQNSIQSVHWPAVVKLKSDDELIFILDALQFDHYVTLNLLHTQPEDLLIDATGVEYRFDVKLTQQIIRTERLWSLHEVLEMLRRHLSSNGSCCVTKFYSNSIREEMMSVVG
jgi:hypothetical protein